MIEDSEKSSPAKRSTPTVEKSSTIQDATL